MRYSSLTDRLHSDGNDGWAVHFEAWQAIAAGEKDVIVLSVGDPDFSTPEPIVERTVDALRGGDTHYAEIAGRPRLRSAIAQDMATRTGMDLSAENVLVCGGTQNALMAASMCILDAGDEVIALDPMYLTYEATLRLMGAELVRVPQHADTGFRPDVDALAAAVAEKTRAIALTTPNNPTGVVLTTTELEAIARVAIENDLWVIVDEVYADLVFDGEHVSMAALAGMAERTVTVSSFSKSHAMTGWRIGWAIAPAPLVEHFDALQINVLYGLPGFIQEGALVAITDERAASEEMRQIYLRRRDVAAAVLATSPHLDVLIPEAGMYLLIDVRKVAESSAAFTRNLFDEMRVSVVDAGAFGQPAEGWIRVSFTIDEERLAAGCERIVEFAARGVNR